MNVLLIAVDTLRADHLGCYGYARDTSPNVDAFASESALFESFYAGAIPTHPSFTTVNTGQYSITHGIVAHGGDKPLPKGGPWLAESMQKAGYTTCAVDNLAHWRNGFGRGYEFCIDPMMRRTLSIQCDNREINRRALAWIEQYGREPFFMFVHYWDPHTPYLPPRAYRRLFYKGKDPFDAGNHSLDGMRRHPLGRTWAETWFPQLGGNVTDAEYIVALYDGEVRYCDEGIGQLLRQLEEMGLAEDTLVVLLGDHGELMYRHGVFFDHHGLYDGNIHVPLILRCPGMAPRRLPWLTQTVDVAPTILDLCEVPVPEEMEGNSLAPYVHGKLDAPQRDFIISQECTWQMKWCIRTARHKLILAREEDFYGNPMRELYDLEKDPGEFRNIAGDEPDTAAALEERLEGWIRAKMEENGLEEDPLVANGLTLGAAWKRERGLAPARAQKP